MKIIKKLVLCGGCENVSLFGLDQKKFINKN